IVNGRIFVAPPDVHLLLFRRRIRLVRGPKENGNRPAIDPMFRSAALAFGARVIGVVLTGNLDDGTAGIRAIKRAGGVAVVQDPADAPFPAMPQSAIDHAAIDRVVPINEVADAIQELASKEVMEAEHTLMSEDTAENAFTEGDIRTIGDA